MIRLGQNPLHFYCLCRQPDVFVISSAWFGFYTRAATAVILAVNVVLDILAYGRFKLAVDSINYAGIPAGAVQPGVAAEPAACDLDAAVVWRQPLS